MRLLATVAALVATCLSVASAEPLARSSPVNPYMLRNPGNAIVGAGPVLDTGGRAIVRCLPLGSNTAVLVVAGQSLSVNNVPTLYTPTQANNHQFNIYDGGCYKTKEPLLGINISGEGQEKGTWISRLADKLIADGHYSRVIIVPMAVGGTSIAQWSEDGPPLYLRDRIRTVARRLFASGLPCTAVLWGQGESDTGLGTSQASYATNLAAVTGAFHDSLPACPVLVAREAYYYGSTSAAVLAAQDAAVNNSTVFAGADMEQIGSSGRYDNTHLNATGAAQAAALWEAALVAGLHL